MAAEITKDLTGTGPIMFDLGAQTVPTGALTQIANLLLGGNKEYAVLELIVGPNALTHLSVTRTSYMGGNHVTIAADAALNTSTYDIPSAAPASISTLGAGLSGSIRFGQLRGVQELGIWAQSAVASTLQIRGTAIDEG
jgi:hypothetical protein